MRPCFRAFEEAHAIVRLWLRFAPSEPTIQFLPDWHPFQRFLNIASEFGASQDDQTESMQIDWGLESAGLDTAGANLLFVRDARNLSSADYGTILYSPTFQFNEATQLHIKSACDLLATYLVVV